MVAVCQSCGKKFKSYPSQQRKFCSIKCYGDWAKRTGFRKEASNGQWKGGNYKFFREKAIAAIKKSNLSLDYCWACKQKKSRLHVHHKDRNRKNCSLSNLLVLCNLCHQKAHKKDYKHCHLCGGFIWEGTKHKCFDKSLLSISGRLKGRERCPKCGKLFGKDNSKHSCEHPRGMKGKKQSKETKDKIRETLEERQRTTDELAKVFVKEFLDKVKEPLLKPMGELVAQRIGQPGLTPHQAKVIREAEKRYKERHL